MQDPLLSDRPQLHLQVQLIGYIAALKQQSCKNFCSPVLEFVEMQLAKKKSVHQIN
jgi:hypothetical protein